jgi:hypothetical protein
LENRISIIYFESGYLKKVSTFLFDKKKVKYLLTIDYKECNIIDVVISQVWLFKTIKFDTPGIVC